MDQRYSNDKDSATSDTKNLFIGLTVVGAGAALLGVILHLLMEIGAPIWDLLPANVSPFASLLAFVLAFVAPPLVVLVCLVAAMRTVGSRGLWLLLPLIVTVWNFGASIAP